MSKQASRRVAQFNLLFTPSELRELKERADRDTGGNVSELIRRAMFSKAEQAEDRRVITCPVCGKVATVDPRIAVPLMPCGHTVHNPTEQNSPVQAEEVDHV